MKAVVIRSTGSWYEIRTTENIILKARLRGKFKFKNLKVTNPIAVGDNVTFEIEDEQQNTAVITEIAPRENYIIRQSVHKANQGHLIASNVDQTILIVTMKQPRTSLGFIDRFLVSAEAFRIPAVIVFNKADIYSPEELLELDELSLIYEQLGYRCIYTNALAEQGLESLQKAIKGKISVLSGHSGVGKSTVLNNLDKSLSIRTSDVSLSSDKGVHTTTFAEMYQVNEDTYVIDTPGIKELALFDISKEELGHYFPEFRALLGSCKFHNCIHLNEPKCAVIEGVQSGKIAWSRYQSYMSMLENSDSHR